MIKEQLIELTQWVTAYRDNPATLSRSSIQAIAIEIHEYMSHGEWKTSNAIASELAKPLYSVRLVMKVIRDHWGYESSRKLGYRRLEK